MSVAGSSNRGQPVSREVGVITQWRSNPGGFAGLVMSIVQLFMHGLWIGLTEMLAAGGNLEDVTTFSWQAWLSVALLLLSGVTTMLALFLSLYGSIDGQPKTPAVIGLTVSFFTGASVTFVLILTALTSGEQP